MKKTTRVPRQYRGPTKRIKKGLLIIYTGKGKGKTTAAFGAVLRCLGRGMKVAVVQFMKGKWKSGEVQALEKFKPQVTYFSVGEGFTWETKSLKRDVALAKKAWDICRSLLNRRRHQVYLFDELLYVLKYQFLSLKAVVPVLKRRDPHVHVILTGRDAPPALIQMADLVTEMKEVKHPFRKGILAQPGIDF